MKRLIIGLGSGRCGTVSLKHLLALQPDTTATHEAMILPYPYNEFKYKNYMKRLLSRKTEISADVALWVLPYVTTIFEEHPTTKFICLKRERHEVVNSFIRKTPKRNHWTSFRSSYWNESLWPNEKKCPYRNCYPRFDEDKAQAIGMYWDWYYTIFGYYQKMWPDNFRVFPMEDLNISEGCDKILRFAGYENPVIQSGIHKNKGRQ